jgi:hypothetical protein
MRTFTRRLNWEFARNHAGTTQLTPSQVIAKARELWPAFEEGVRALCL